VTNIVEEKKALAKEVLARLLSKTPEPKIELNYENPFQLLVATILAAQCTDLRVNMVTKNFFKDYPTPAKLARESQQAVAEKIKATGFYRNKANSLIACCQRLVKEYNGEVPKTIAELEKLPGVGRKTASVVVSNAYGVPALSVDTHVKRVAGRLNLSQARTPEACEEEMAEFVAPESWTLFSQLLVLHGRYVCVARNPKCKVCVLTDICPSDEKILT
jgi:endonuclease III